MKLADLLTQLKDETTQLIIDTKQTDGADAGTCDSLQSHCNDLLYISVKLTGNDSDTTNQLLKVNRTLARMLNVD